MIFSRILEGWERRDMGRYDLGEKGSGLLGLGMIIVELFLQDRGKYPCVRHFWSRLWNVFSRGSGRFLIMRLEI